jgi:hypothetical protein
MTAQTLQFGSKEDDLPATRATVFPDVVQALQKGFSVLTIPGVSGLFVRLRPREMTSFDR